jgi:hypothetical protein
VAVSAAGGAAGVCGGTAWEDRRVTKRRVSNICDLLLMGLALTGAVLGAFDRNWTTVIWASLTALWVGNAWMRGKAAAEWKDTARVWKDAYDTARSRADRAQWGNHLS